MRLLRLLFCVVLLAAIGAAQTSSSSSSSSSAPQEQAQQPPATQPPPSPLEEPKKPSEAEANKPKASTFDVTQSAATGQDQDVGEIRLMSRQTELSGDKTRSFRAQGENNLAEFNYFMDRRFLSGARRMQVLSMYRGTDDHSIDPEHNSLQKAFFRIYGPRDEYIFGDALINYSRLTFNQNVKGAGTAIKIGDDWKVSAFGGAFVDRYGSFYKELCTTSVTHACLPGRPYTALVSGARLERHLGRDSSFGFNFSSSDDRVDTLPAAPVGTAPFPASNRVGSVDTRLQFVGVRLEGEFAYSGTDFDTRSSGPCPAPCDDRQPQPALGFQNDWGTRVDGTWRHHKFSLRGSYARYQPNFASINARQINDLQDETVRASYELTDWLTADGTFRRSNNDLRGQLPFETRLLGPEAKFAFHDLPFYRRGIFEVGYRQRDVDASDGSIERFVRMPFAELTLPYHTTFFGIGYERREAVDLRDQSQTSNTDRVYLSLRGIYDLGGWHINPSLRYELERQSQRPRLGNTTTPLEFLLDYNSNRLGMASLFIEAPKWFILEGAFHDSSATLPSLAPNGLTLVPAGYSRPAYKAALTYKIRNDENTTLIFSFERNSNFYFISPDFDERVYGVAFVYKFGHHARTQ